MSEATGPDRVTATPAAREAIARLRAARGFSLAAGPDEHFVTRASGECPVTRPAGTGP